MADANTNRRAGGVHRSRSHRKVSIGSDMDLSPIKLPQDPEEKEGILLLLGMSNIVKAEMASNTEIFHEDESTESDRPQLDEYLSYLNKRAITGSPSSLMDDSENRYAWNRARTVSIDSPKSHACSPKHIALPPIVSPSGPSRLRNSRKPTLKITPCKGKKESVKFPKLPHLHRHQQQLQQQQQGEESVQEHHRKVLKVSSEKGIPVTKIHRRKFSWKSYPGTYLLRNN